MATHLTRVDVSAPADTVARLSLQGSASPQILFGPGSAGAQDTRVQRSTAGSLLVDANNVAATNVVLDLKPQVTGTSSEINLWNLASPTNAAIRLQTGTGTNPSLQFGPGTSANDFRIYRNSAGNVIIDANGQAANLVLDLKPQVASQGSTINLWNLASPTNAAISLQTGTSTLPAILMGPGTAAADIYVRRSAPKTLIVDTDGAGGVLTTVDFKTTNLYQNGSPITAIATQVSSDIDAGSTATYVARAKLTADTHGIAAGIPSGTRVWLGTDANDRGALLFGVGGTTPMDLRIRHAGGAGTLTIDGLTSASQTLIQVRSTSGQTNKIDWAVVGDTGTRVNIEADATLTAIGMGDGTNTDLLLSRIAAGSLKLNANALAATDTLLTIEALSGRRANLSLLVAGDTNSRLDLSGDATLTGIVMGPGNTTGDLSIARTSGGSLKISANGAAFNTNVTQEAASGKANQLVLQVAGDTGGRAILAGDAGNQALWLGSGSATDIFLYRSASKVLEIDADGAGGALKVSIAGELDLPTAWTTTIPVAPATGVAVYARALGMPKLSQETPSGFDRPFSVQMYHTLSYWIPDGNGTNIRILRGGTLVAQGTATSTGAISTASYSSAMYYSVKAVSGAIAGNFAEFREPDQRLFFGNTAGMGGFDVTIEFSLPTAASTSDRIFVGLSTTSGAFANSNPSALLNLFGIAADAGDTNLQAICNAGSGTATKVDLGGNYLKATTTNVYHLHLYAAPNSTGVTWTIHRMDSPAVAMQTGTFAAAKLPAVNTLMNTHLWRSNNATAAACAIAFGAIVIEKEG